MTRRKLKVVTRLCWLPHEDAKKLTPVKGELQPFKEGVQLFHSLKPLRGTVQGNAKRGRLWWLAYNDRNDHNTGSFQTKREATGWYENGGR